MENSLRIKDLPKEERPRERLLRYGADSLSNSELISVILRTGTSSESILNLSNRVITECGGFGGLTTCSIEDLMKLKGIGEAKASQLAAVIEISKRFKNFKAGKEIRISSPRDAAELLMEEMRHLCKETLKVVMLNTKNYVLCVKDISIGSLNSSIVHPREVFSEAIKKSSASIIICHNHPSGDPTPSDEDINVTRRISECGKLLGISLTDHIIIGDGIYVSLKEKGIL